MAFLTFIAIVGDPDVFRVAPADADKLIEYWGSKVANALAADLRADGSKLVINLASNE